MIEIIATILINIIKNVIMILQISILNNEDKKVTVVFDKDLKGQEKVGFHPNTNKATVYLTI